MSDRPKITVIAPVYNEEGVVNEFYKRLKAVLQNIGTHEIVFVNDGSSDSSYQKLCDIRQNDPAVRVLNFSRNFGHQIAVKAGIDHANGEVVIIMDTDLQDPPEVIPDFIKKQKEGYDVVYAVRAKREGESWFKKWTASLYYRIMKRIVHIDMPLDAGDFRLITRPVADAVRRFGEKSPYIRGLISWVGFRQIGIPIHRQARFAGETKYSLKKMCAFAWSGVTHFSFLPLQISTFIGILTSVICVAFIVLAVYARIGLNIAVPGWASIMVAVLFLGSVQLITLGILGSYLARNYDEARNRPLYILKDQA